MFETELKARISNRRSLLKLLQEKAIVQKQESIYEDTYFDREGDSLTRTEQELRLRIIKRDGTFFRSVLTYKGIPFDEVSKSKPEYETVVESPDMMREILLHTGYKPCLSFIKECIEVSLYYQEHLLSVTWVRLPESGDQFVEVETKTEKEEETPMLFQVLYAFLEELGIEKSSVTSEYYTDLIRQYRKNLNK